MTSFKDRGKAEEAKFVIDEELRFKAFARRNKLLGLWAAEKLGKAGTDADEYARAVVLADFEEPGEEDVFRKVRKDFDGAGLDVSDHQIRREMEALLVRAHAEIREGI